MSCIAGIFKFSGPVAPGAACRTILQALSPYAPHGDSTAELDEVALGRALHRLLPEDQFDRQPLSGGDGRFLLVADARVDNRQELGAALGIDPERQQRMSDADFLLAGFEQWEDRLFDRIAGDFAIAVWDSQERRLTLARDATGQRPLFHYSCRDFLAFATMPQALHAVSEIPCALNLKRLAEHASDMLPQGADTVYEGIKRVEPGHILIVDRAGAKTWRYWNPAPPELRLARTADYVDAFREQLDRSTAARLRRAGGLVASQLSGGYDSSAVSATAACLLAQSGERLLAFTSAPRPGLNIPTPRGRVLDESPYAALTAAMHPNIDHHIVRLAPTQSALARLSHTHRAMQHPVSQVSNSLWWSEISDQARRLGATILLTGQMGNMTLHAGGLMVLPDYVRQGRLLTWLREARGAVERGPARWRGVLINSFGPWIPRFLFVWLRTQFMKTSTRTDRPYLLGSDWARRVDNSERPGRDGRPRSDSYALRRDLIMALDLGESRKSGLRQWGIDERDPTADQRVIEFSLSLPREQLFRNGVSRPLARAALADRLPPEVLNDPPRGYQHGAWFEHVPMAELRREVDLIEASPSASEVLNVSHMREMLDRWPTGDLNVPWVVQEYRLGLLQAVATGHFIRTFSCER